MFYFSCENICNQFIQHFHEYQKYYVKASVKQNLAFGLMLKPSNKIVGACLYYDMTTINQIHKNQPQNQDQNMNKFYNEYKVQEQLFKIMINFENYKKGESGYLMFFAVDPDFANYRLGPLCAVFGARKMFDMGYKKLFAITYNSVSLNISLNLSGKIIAKLRNQQQNLDFILGVGEFSNTLDNILNTYIEANKLKTLKDMIKKLSNRIPKSKL